MGSRKIFITKTDIRFYKKALSLNCSDKNERNINKQKFYLTY